MHELRFANQTLLRPVPVQKPDQLGVIPPGRAARVDPMTALRYE